MRIRTEAKMKRAAWRQPFFLRQDFCGGIQLGDALDNINNASGEKEEAAFASAPTGKAGLRAMFRIEFDGRILPGFAPQIVHMEVALRLRLRDEQVRRMFSGRTVVLKKRVPGESCERYLNELRGMGLDARAVSLDGPEPVAALFKMVYWGRVLPGFERSAVMADALRTLRLTPSQAKLCFSGMKTVIARSMDARTGRRALRALEAIGMQVELEAELPEPPVPISRAAESEDASFSALLGTHCDLSTVSFDPGADFAPPEPETGAPEAPQMPAAASPYAAANRDGFVNCPHCGVYQARAANCAACDGVLPGVSRLYVGRASPELCDAQTVVGELPPVAAPVPRKAHKPAASLHDELQRQQQALARANPTRRPRPGVWLGASLLAGLAGLALLGLSRIW